MKEDFSSGNSPRVWSPIGKWVTVWAVFTGSIIAGCGYPAPVTPREANAPTQDVSAIMSEEATAVPSNTNRPQPAFTQTITQTVSTTATDDRVVVPSIVNHPQPTLMVDAEPFAGMQIDACEELREDNMLGGLQPEYPVAYCITDYEKIDMEDFEKFAVEMIEKMIEKMIDEGNDPSSISVSTDDYCLSTSVGMITYCNNLLVIVDDSYRIIHTTDELAELYAPIDSPEEALSYALATTDYEAIFDPEERHGLNGYAGFGPSEAFQFHVTVFEDTHVEEGEDGYFVYLFDRPLGCSPWSVYSVPIEVSHSGSVNELPRVKLLDFDNYMWDEEAQEFVIEWMCVD